jgi:hypothetical protein
MGGLPSSPASAGWPLHEVSFGGRDATLLKSLGPGNGELVPGEPEFEVLAPARDGGFWTASQRVYEFRKWSRPGELQATFKRSPDWFAKRSRVDIGNPRTPPEPLLTGIQEDSVGLVSLVVRVPSPTWQQGWRNLKPGQREIAPRFVELEDMFDAMIEVVDPGKGVVLARRRFDGMLYAGLGRDRRIAAYQVDEDGEPLIKVLSVRLAGRP